LLVIFLEVSVLNQTDFQFNFKIPFNCSKTIFQTIAKKIPTKLNNKGIFFMNNGINSKSIPTLLFSKIKIELPQKMLPTPTKGSFSKYPENILPKDKTLKAKPILLGNS